MPEFFRIYHTVYLTSPPPPLTERPSRSPAHDAQEMVKTGSNRQWNGDPDQRSQIRHRQRFEDGLVERYKVPKGTQFTIHTRDYMPRE